MNVEKLIEELHHELAIRHLDSPVSRTAFDDMDYSYGFYDGFALALKIVKRHAEEVHE